MADISRAERERINAIRMAHYAQQARAENDGMANAMHDAYMTDPDVVARFQDQERIASAAKPARKPKA